jgi:hypothetical protein
VAGISIRDLVLKDVLPALVASLALLAASYAAVQLLSSLRTPTVLVIVLAGLVGLAVYGLVLRVLFPATSRDVALLIHRIRSRGGGREESSTATLERVPQGGDLAVENQSSSR